MKYLIERYISSITKKDIISFAGSNNIYLDDYEVTILYECMHKHYNDFLNGDESFLEDIKKKFDKEKFNKIYNLYLLYKEKYKGYL